MPLSLPGAGAGIVVVAVVVAVLLLAFMLCMLRCICTRVELLPVFRMQQPPAGGYAALQGLRKQNQ